ncbi:uncharacterized protein LOC111038525 [Myzus persicae]|uniref:uncharacterized protein LOC111038525 n=1 Tax=Myzus persicae TaxID=13164 RepID=UPI000B937EDA|nr:uncharacterized protein LOC111038525 [Myzus persicae]
MDKRYLFQEIVPDYSKLNSWYIIMKFIELFIFITQNKCVYSSHRENATPWRIQIPEFCGFVPQFLQLYYLLTAVKSSTHTGNGGGQSSNLVVRMQENGKMLVTASSALWVVGVYQNILYNAEIWIAKSTRY